MDPEGESQMTRLRSSARPVLLALLAAAWGLLAGGCTYKIEPKIQLGSGKGGPSQTAGGASDKEGWEGLAYASGRYLLGSEGGVLFYAYDTLARPGEEVELAAQLLYDLDGIEGVTLAFDLDGRRVGSAETDGDGLASIRWTPDSPGDHAFDVRIVSTRKETWRKELSKIDPTPLLVAARRRDAQLAVIDLDHTLVDSSFLRVLIGGAKPMPDSVRVTQRLREDYTIVYLTHRPNILTRKSKQWLRTRGYPRGVLMVSSLSEVADSGAFKTARLAEVRQAFPNLRYGIGDKYSDAQAYVDNGLEAFLIPHYDPEDRDEVRQAIRSIRNLKGQGRLHVVSGWVEVEQGIYQDADFPPEQYVAQLDDRLARLDDEDEDDDEDEEDDDEEEEDDD